MYKAGTELNIPTANPGAAQLNFIHTICQLNQVTEDETVEFTILLHQDFTEEELETFFSEMTLKLQLKHQYQQYIN
jgi:uncharacterized protein YsxB (DUF464 family)